MYLRTTGGVSPYGLIRGVRRRTSCSIRGFPKISTVVWWLASCPVERMSHGPMLPRIGGAEPVRSSRSPHEVC
jgi:hypothetical protein